MKLFQLWVVFNSCFFMMLYFLSFLRLKYSMPGSILICAISTICATGQEFLRIYFVFDEMWPRLIVTALNIIMVQSAAIVLSKKKDSYVVFTGFSASNFVLAGNVSSCAVLMTTRNVYLAMATCTLVNVVVFGIIYVFVGEIRKHEFRFNFWMCIIPAMCYITSFFQLYFPVSFEKNPQSLIAGGALLVTVVVMYVLFIRYIGSKAKENELLLRNNELRFYIQGMELQAEAVESAFQSFQVMRHDMRHKDYLLTELLHEKKYEEAERMLYEDIEKLDKVRMARYSENVVINGILISMEKKAEKREIKTRISCAIPKRQKISDYDLAMLVANLFENAIQAVAELKPQERLITLTLKNRANENFFMEVINPCAGEVRFSKKTGLPVSFQGGEHGYGMMSVQGFVEKYQAHIDCFQEGNRYTVRIYIPFL